MITHEITRDKDGRYSPILIKIPDNAPVGWNLAMRNAILKAIIRAYHCRQCAVFKDSKLTTPQPQGPVSPPSIRSHYLSPKDSSNLQINFICPNSGTYHRRFRCFSPHTIKLRARALR